MKNKFIVIGNVSNKIKMCIIAICVVIICISAKNVVLNKSIDMPMEIATNEVEYNESILKENNIKEEITKVETVLKRDKTIPEKIDKYKVIGKIEIPAIKLTTYILEKSTKESLKKSVAKLYGPEINQIGNFCIVGHNYNKTKMFGNLKKLKLGDKIYLVDIYGNKVEYSVYDIFKVKPSETDCLNQETDGEKEVTLITCTETSLNRVIIKAISV